MKKKICGLLLTGLALTACGDLSGYMRADRNAPFKTRLRACMLSEANDKLQNGTLLDKTLKETADEIADDCLRKLALQSAGLDDEAVSTAGEHSRPFGQCRQITSGAKNEKAPVCPGFLFEKNPCRLYLPPRRRAPVIFFLQGGNFHFGVTLGGGKRSVSEQLLNGSQVGFLPPADEWRTMAQACGVTLPGRCSPSRSRSVSRWTIRGLRRPPRTPRNNASSS